MKLSFWLGSSSSSSAEAGSPRSRPSLSTSSIRTRGLEVPTYWIGVGWRRGKGGVGIKGVVGWRCSFVAGWKGGGVNDDGRKGRKWTCPPAPLFLYLFPSFSFFFQPTDQPTNQPINQSINPKIPNERRRMYVVSTYRLEALDDLARHGPHVRPSVACSSTTEKKTWK